MRLVRETALYLLCGASLAGLAASARYAVDPPQPVAEATLKPASGGADLGAEGFASLFTRDYLTWDAAAPQAHERALEPFAGQAMAAGAGLKLPRRGSERVEWTQIVGEREARPGEHVYTVAAGTNPSGPVYLSVSVKRTSAGELALAGYPAFVGAPASRPAAADFGGLEPVRQAGLWTVVARALGSYLAGSDRGLKADLTPGARVSLPALGLSLLSLMSLRWTPPGGPVVADVVARGRSGARYRLAYELDVLERAGRWEISAIQTDPDR